MSYYFATNNIAFSVYFFNFFFSKIFICNRCNCFVQFWIKWCTWICFYFFYSISCKYILKLF